MYLFFPPYTNLTEDCVPMCLPLKISSGSLYSRHCSIGNSDVIEMVCDVKCAGTGDITVLKG